ncbi:MAG: hypothetical protein OEY14_01810 [Myxococcales bacterium]|nr:hypothetical protein [Myxococcales bacterium]
MSGEGGLEASVDGLPLLAAELERIEHFGQASFRLPAQTLEPGATLTFQLRPRAIP